MDVLTFVAEIAKAAAWPAAAVTIALLFRAQFRALLGRLRKGKLGPAEFEFENALRELEVEASASRTATQLAPPSLPTASEVARDPRAVIMQSWVEVETAIVALSQKHKLFNALQSPTSTQRVRALQRAELLRPEQVALFTELRFLRNRAAHEVEFSPSTESVQSFARLAKELAAEVQREL